LRIPCFRKFGVSVVYENLEGRFRASITGLEDRGFSLRSLDVESAIAGYEALTISWIVTPGFILRAFPLFDDRSSKLSEIRASELTDCACWVWERISLSKSFYCPRE